ncbi:Gfo/Idh/MocA family oxidoreductase [Rugosimonospora acidiphila]|uniref:Gfo/Idh/MocA family oxidoreductase n=1 Tax=Rugosimonospora acidiphila TaxID=556531 RepID=A0ABP9SLA4_9ACTN
MNDASRPADLRLAVIGLGARGHLAELAHRPGRGARVVACADPRPAALADARRRFGPDVAVHDDYRALDPAGIDAAMVLTPDHLHEPVATHLLAAGVATFVEKPLAITTAGADRVLAAARAAGARLYVGHNLRHAPFVTAMRDLVAEGAIGEVTTIWCRHFVGHGGDYYFKDWHADRRYTNGLLLQKGAHDLDVIHWLAGAPTAVASAFGNLRVYGDLPRRELDTDRLMPDWFDPTTWPPQAQRDLHPTVDVEDLSVVNLRLANGVLATYQQCHYTPDYWRNYTVIGTRGRLENFGDLTGATIRVWNARRSGYRADADLELPVPAAGAGRGGSGDHGGADRAVVDEFLEHARTGRGTVTSPISARDAVAAACAATDSLRAGGVPVSTAAPAPEDVAYFGQG